MACTSQCSTNVCNLYIAPNEVWNYDGSGFDVVAGCASNATNPTSAGATIYNENMDRLAGAIQDEQIRRGVPVSSFDNITGNEEGTGTLIYGVNAGVEERMRAIKAAINTISSGYVTYTISDGNPITFAQFQEARSKINSLRASCICNSDCGGHVVCACFGNCGCNYSDKRLKRHIRSL